MDHKFVMNFLVLHKIYHCGLTDHCGKEGNRVVPEKHLQTIFLQAVFTLDAVCQIVFV